MRPRADLVLTLGFVGLFAITTAGWAQTQLPRNPVTPYCATLQSEFTRTLAGGTHIVQKTKEHTCRDSLGRSRTESFGVKHGTEISAEPVTIFISDPIADVRYYLDVETHSGTQTSMRTAGPPRSATVPPAPGIPTPPAALAENGSEQLGSQTIEGLLVGGVRMTATYPVGTIGNDAPIVVVTESWVSKELGRPVLATTNDPRSGVTVWRLTDIDRSEPDPSLFRVPPEYKLKDLSRGPG